MTVEMKEIPFVRQSGGGDVADIMQSLRQTHQCGVDHVVKHEPITCILPQEVA